MKMNMRESGFQNELKIKYILPKRIVISENTTDTDTVLEDRPLQPVLADVPVMRIMQGGYVLLDFGAEFQGGADITVQEVPQNRAQLRLVFGESVSEALSEIGVKNATNNHAVRDMVAEVGNWSRQSFGNTGFRFLKLEAVKGDIYISGVRGVFRYRDIPRSGSFRCSDELLNRIWETGAYTVHLNMQEYLWDGIKRDRLVWVGDMHPEIMTIAAVFGYNEVVPKSLDLIRDVTPPEAWMNNIPSYTMQWIRIQHEWYFYTGNSEYLKAQETYLYAVLEHILNALQKNGTNAFSDKFVDWSLRDTEWEEAGFLSVLILALKDGQELCRILGNGGLSGRCGSAVEALKNNVPRYSGSKQAAALAALAELADAESVNNDLIKKDGAHGLSAFLGCYTLMAMAKAGDVDGALNMVRNYWGGMLKMGATTFWEDFDIEWMENAAGIDEPVPAGRRDIHGDFGKFCYKQFRHSLCHGWSSGPTSFMSRYLLGVEVLEPGFKRVRISPCLGGLDWIEGSIPTPYGAIKIKCDNSGAQILAPDEIEICQ